MGARFYHEAPARATEPAPHAVLAGRRDTVRAQGGTARALNMPRPRPSADAVVFALALAVRAVYWLEVRDSDLYLNPLLDAAYYDEWARHLAGLAPFDKPTQDQAPLFPYLLSVVYRLFGPGVGAVAWTHFFLGALTAVLVGRFAATAFSPPVGRLAGILAAVYPPFFFNEATVMPTALAIGLTVALGIAAQAVGKRSAPRGSAAALGAVAGLAFLCRAESVVFASLVAVWIAVRARFSPRVLAPVVLLGIAGFAPFLAAFGLHYQAATGRFRLLPASGGLNLYVGNNPESIGSGHTPSTLARGRETVVEAGRRLAEREAGRPLSPEEIDEHLRAKAIRFATDHPGRYLGLLLKKLRLSVHGSEVSDVLPYDFMDRESSVKRLLSSVADFRVLGALALLGAAIAIGRREGGAAVPLLLVAAQTIVLLLIFVTARFRAIAAPAWIAFAASAIVFLLRSLRNRASVKRGVAAAAALVPLALLLNWPLEATRLDDGQVHINIGNLRARAGDLDGAIAAYLEAERAAPDSPAPLRARAAALRDADRTAEAAAVLAETVARFPGDADSLIALGEIRSRAGETDRALEAFRAARRADPTDAVAPFDEAVVLANARRFDEAVEPARAAVRLAPSNPGAWNQLAWVLLNGGEREEAVAVAERAVKLSSRRDPIILDTLAEAYAAIGDTAKERAVREEIERLR